MRFNKNDKKIIYYVLILIVLLLLLFKIGFLSNLNLFLTDNLYENNKVLSNILIVEIDDKSLKEIGRWPWNRDKIAKILERLKDAKIIGVDIGFYEKTSQDKSLKEIIENNNNIILSAQWTKFEKKNNYIIGKELLIPIFNTSSGYVNVIIDRDGIVRAINPNIKGPIKSFPETIYNKYTKKNLKYNGNRYLINFVPYESFERISATDVLKKNNLSKLVKNKIILLGVTSENLKDNFLVPISKEKKMPGVGVLANALQTMILNNNLKEMNEYQLLFLIVILSILTTFICIRFNIIVSTLSIFIIIISYIFISIIFFKRFNMILNLVYPILLVITIFIITYLYKYNIEKKNKKKIKKIFSKYVSPKVVEQLINEKKFPKLGGDIKEVSILFSDIVNFTKISEELPPEKLVLLLNEYLTEMTKIILKNDGTVDKFIGDAIMTFWNAPLKQKNHCELACKTALEMQNNLKKLRKKWKKKFGKEIYIRIGIHTGEAILGNIGSENRFDYTIIGDNVNIASRLEGLNKEYKTEILVSKNTYERVKDKFKFKKIGNVKVKGKRKSVVVYELIDFRK